MLLDDSATDGHASVLHACCASPVHAAPLPDGAGLLQLRLCVPPPHDAEHSDQLDQPPLTVSSHATPVLLAGVIEGLCCVHESTVSRS